MLPCYHVTMLSHVHVHVHVHVHYNTLTLYMYMCVHALTNISNSFTIEFLNWSQLAIGTNQLEPIGNYIFQLDFYPIGLFASYIKLEYFPTNSNWKIILTA